MRLKILFLLSLLFCFADFAQNTFAANNTVCLEKGKKLFAAKEYTQAKTTFEQCVKEDPASVDALLSLAGADLTLENLDEAEKNFQAALKKMPRTSPYISYTYSMLGDIALKKQKNADALSFYSKSLESNAANVNSLVGKGVITVSHADELPLDDVTDIIGESVIFTNPVEAVVEISGTDKYEAIIETDPSDATITVASSAEGVATASMGTETNSHKLTITGVKKGSTIVTITAKKTDLADGVTHILVRVS